MLPAALVVLAALVAGVVVVSTSQGALRIDGAALANVSPPLGGGQITEVRAITGPHSQAVGIKMEGDRIWPVHTLAVGERIALQVTVKRPGWISWLSGATQQLRLTVVTPKAGLIQQYLTLADGAPLQLRFRSPIAAISDGSGEPLVKHVLSPPQVSVTLPRTAAAGSVWVAAVPRTWERTVPTLVSWFPAGARASAVASPRPGSRITPATPIVLTFSKPVAQALGSARPPVSPATPGVWHEPDSHTIVFMPEGYGYGLGANVTVALPAGVELDSATRTATGTIGSWHVPAGSTVRLQQLLATLGYLPLRFEGAAVAPTAMAQEAAAVSPPAGRFSWRYGNVPAALRAFWQPGSAGVMTRGAVMAFENDQGLAADGLAGPGVWRALIAAVVHGQRSSFGYTFATVSKAAQKLVLWHNGKTVLSTLVNTGIASRPTDSGTYPVYEHLSSTTMSGTNPDGSHYSDPGVSWVSYFNGGDALHGFTRAQYGYPQSLGCVEIPVGTAAKVWPYTPIGTLVHVV